MISRNNLFRPKLLYYYALQMIHTLPTITADKYTKFTASLHGIRILFTVFLLLIFQTQTAANTDISDRVTTSNEAAVAVQKVGSSNVRIAQLIQGKTLYRNYANAVPTLLEEINKRTSVKVDLDPAIISSFESDDIYQYPLIYANFADRTDWTFSTLEQRNLKRYLNRGGFIFIDAGINAEFLRKNIRHGQHHSFADWEVSPEIKEAFTTVFPGKQFRPLTRDHRLFEAFYQGLPDPSNLPDTVKEFVVNEKWPHGTYSAVALTVKGRVAVLATPIISMGWGKNQLGNWSTNIRFRIREGTTGLSDYLETAAYSGARYEGTREDGNKDTIYCQQEALPSWVQEPGDKWRVFRYYQSREISDYAHVFYTQLGINIVAYALTH